MAGGPHLGGAGPGLLPLPFHSEFQRNLSYWGGGSAGWGKMKNKGGVHLHFAMKWEGGCNGMGGIRCGPGLPLEAGCRPSGEATSKTCSRYPEPGAWAMGSGIWDLGPGSIPGTWAPGPGAWYPVPGIRNLGPGQWDLGSGSSGPVPYLEPGAPGMVHGSRFLISATRFLANGMWDLGPRTRYHTCNLATGTWAVRPGPWDLGPGISWNMGPVT